MVPARIAAKSQLSAGELEGGTEVEPAALPALTHKTADDMAQATAAADDNKVSLASTATEPEA